MVIPEGYKKTEIGIIPEDWSVVPFEKAFSILHNNTLSRAELNCYNGDIQNIHYGDVLIKYPFILDCSKEKIPYINDDRTFTASKGFLQDGDIIISDTAEDEVVGKATEIIGVNGRKVVSGLHTIPCRAKNINTFALRWLGYYINSRFFHDQIIPYITGIKVSSISKISLFKTLVAYPRKSEQERIVAALSDIDILIDNLEKLISKKKNIKQGAMQELLTAKRRLPGFDGEWTVKSIGESGHLCKETVNPQSSPLVFFCEYSMPAFDVGKKPIMRYGSEMHSNRTVISGNVLLFNKLNVRQKRIWLINAEKENSVCSSEFLAYSSDQIDLLYLNYLLNTNEVTKDFIDSSTGTSNSQKRITPNTFLSYSITVPSDIEEQTAIASILSDMDNEIEELEKKLAKYRCIKQGMMSELLTGHIRLTEKEDA